MRHSFFAKGGALKKVVERACIKKELNRIWILATGLTRHINLNETIEDYRRAVDWFIVSINSSVISNRKFLSGIETGLRKTRLWLLHLIIEKVREPKYVKTGHEIWKKQPSQTYVCDWMLVSSHLLPYGGSRPFSFLRKHHDFFLDGFNSMRMNSEI